MFKFTTTRDNLSDGYKVVSTTLGSVEGSPSSSVLFRVRKGMVEMLSFNGPSNSMSPILASSIEGDASFCMEGKRLNLLLSAIRGNEGIAVAFDPDTKIVSFTGSDGTQKFKTQDTTLFPVYDSSGDIEDLESVAQVRADALSRALKIARSFTDTKSQDRKLSIINLSDGRLESTDRKAICFITVPGIEKVQTKVSADASRSLESFLSKFKDQMVSVIQSENRTYYLMTDGAVFGENLSSYEASSPPSVNNEALASFSIPKSSLDEAFQWLRAGADWTGGLVATLENMAGNLQFTCVSNTGDQITRTVESESAGNNADMSFPLNLDSFHRMFDVFSDNVEFNVSSFTPKGGKGMFYVWTDATDDIGNTYQMMLSQERV